MDVLGIPAASSNAPAQALLQGPVPTHARLALPCDGRDGPPSLGSEGVVAMQAGAREDHLVLKMTSPGGLS